MKINKEQYDTLVAKLDALYELWRGRSETHRKTHEKLDRIEQGQGVLLAKLDELKRNLGQVESVGVAIQVIYGEIQAKLDAIQGNMLLTDFKQGAKRGNTNKRRR